MCDVKDPNFKLFGKTIGLSETCSSDSFMELDKDSLGDVVEIQGSDKSLLNSEKADSKEDSEKSEESKESNANSHSKTLSNTSDTEAVQTSKTEEEDEEEPDTSNSQDKLLKKPDKIVPCPRCKSMETKFCYFNNYNVNQPRHFCKKCQRYWTAGGTMRNVPVGAGRRKNKHVASQFRLPEVLANGIHLNPNGTVLAFSSDATVSNLTASSLNIADNTIQNGVHRPDELNISVSHRNKESRDDHSTTVSKDETAKSDMAPNFHPFPQSVACFPGAPWPYPWNYNSSISPTAFGNPGFPLPFYPTGGPYYCAMPGTWAVPWLIPPPNSGPVPPSSSLNTPILGKHSREDNTKGDDTRREGNPEKCLWFPKTLRIDDPIEAAKSSIWETLGIKNERADMVGGRGGIFKAFGSQSKGEEKIHVQEASKILHANPAALCRSNNFRERC